MSVKISVIIPQRDSLDTLPRLLNSIPQRDDIEVILIDNSAKKISKDLIGSNRDFRLLYSDPKRFAGGARNVGIEASCGEWLIFADADDFFTHRAFDVFLEYIKSPHDLLYFKAKGVYDDTLEPTDRGVMWSTIVEDYKAKRINDKLARLLFLVPWAKMVKRELIDSRNIRFDEVIAANDVMFSTLCGFYSTSFNVVNTEVYYVTTRKGSLANRRSLEVLRSRYLVSLRRNDFLRIHGYGEMQSSVMYYVYNSISFGPKVFVKFIYTAFLFRQNLFIGWRNWFRTYKYCKNSDKKNEKYLLR